jgi:hypothetical protein
MSVILILLYVVIQYLLSDASMLQQAILDGTVMTTIQPSAADVTNNSSNFTYSVWFYINDWNYKYGELKYLFAKVGGAPSSATSTQSVDGLSNLMPCPAVTFDPQQNNLTISLTCFSGKSGTTSIVNNTVIENIPIQKWVNLFFSVYGRTLDTYIDGKLIRTSILPGTANVTKGVPTYLTPMGGFYGWTSKFQYWPNSSDPQHAWDVYSKGYGAGFLDSLLGRYQIKLSFLNNGKETSSVSI